MQERIKLLEQFQQLFRLWNARAKLIALMLNEEFCMLVSSTTNQRIPYDEEKIVVEKTDGEKTGGEKTGGEKTGGEKS